MSTINNKWLDTAPANTIKGNNLNSEARVKDLTRDQVIALLGPGYIVDSLPDADPEIAPTHVAVKQQSDYIDEGEWVKMTFADLQNWIGQFEDTAYVTAGYVESGYVLE